jgi:hypothetical protein
MGWSLCLICLSIVSLVLSSYRLAWRVPLNTRRKLRSNKQIDIWLTQADLAERWSLAEKTLENWRARKYGPRWIQIGRNTVRYRLRDIENWESARERDPSSAVAS